MKKGFILLIASLTMLLTLSIAAVSKETVHAAIKDGTYQINYEMKEAGSQNTSIADGYFTNPATLTVNDGVKYIQLTVTSSSMIKSLSAPSGEVETVSEDKGNETRTVRFRVDGDLSQPVPMDMHIIVPDLYDMNHTARAFFDTSGLDTTASKEEKADKEKESAEKKEKKEDNKEQDKNKEQTNDNPANDAAENASKDEPDEDQQARDKDDAGEADAKADEEEGDEEEEEEKIPEKTAPAFSKPDFAKQVKSVKTEQSTSSNALWISSAVIGALIVAGIILWIVRKRETK